MSQESINIDLVALSAPVEQAEIAQPGRLARAYEVLRNKVAAPLLVVGLGVGAVACGESSDDSARHEAKREVASHENVSNELCEQTWEIKETNNANHRLIAEGVPSIGAAVTNEDARNAMGDVMDIVRNDPEILAGYSEIFLGESVNPSDLEDENGVCASPLAKTVDAKITAKLAFSTITPDQAPSNGINTGVNDSGNVVAASEAGITGNRKAVKVVGPDGSKVWTMERCGNLVVLGQQEHLDCQAIYHRRI